MAHFSKSTLTDPEYWSDAMPDIEDPGPSFEDDLARLMTAVDEVLRHGFEANRRERLVDAWNDVHIWLEEEDNDPRSMGWVGRNGLP